MFINQVRINKINDSNTGGLGVRSFTRKKEKKEKCNFADGNKQMFEFENIKVVYHVCLFFPERNSLVSLQILILASKYSSFQNSYK